MALLKCPDCGSDVSSEASACPRCGRLNKKAAQAAPARRKSSPLAIGCATVIFIVVMAGVLGSLTGHSGGDSAKTEAPVDLNSAESLDNKYGTAASIRCASDSDEYLRSIAKYDFKWDEIGFAESKFDKFLVKASASGVLTMVSQKAKLQNGFGAYQHIKLFCYYDTQAEKVTHYESVPLG